MKKKKFFPIGEAAALAGTTSETLRHYDRIGLVKPGHKDEWTGYRYYTQQDIVRLNTVRALQMMDLSLKEIKEVLSWEDLEKLIAFFDETEKKADKKIETLRLGKKKIQAAKADYERKLKWRESKSAGVTIKELPERVILLSDTLESPTLDNLWNYLSNFYGKMSPGQKEQFYFEDLAGIYAEDDWQRLFALCIRYTDIPGIKKLPAGRYLCADCTQEEREETVRELKEEARSDYKAEADFSVQLVILSGILQWDYEVQVYIGPGA